MIGMIFAAGVGSRLKPWTDFHPKALVPVLGVPMLGRVISAFKKCGINHIIVNVHHKAEQIISYLNSEFANEHITISDETSQLLDTGGALRKIADEIPNDVSVLVHNADILTTLPLKAFVKYFEQEKPDVLLLTGERNTARYLVFDAQGKLKGWTNVKTLEVKPTGLDIAPDDRLRAFDGVHILSAKALKRLKEQYPPAEPFSIIDFYIKNAAALDIRSFELPSNDRWFDLGKPESYQEAADWALQHKTQL